MVFSLDHGENYKLNEDSHKKNHENSLNKTSLIISHCLIQLCRFHGVDGKKRLPSILQLIHSPFKCTHFLKLGWLFDITMPEFVIVMYHCDSCIVITTGTIKCIVLKFCLLNFRALVTLRVMIFLLGDEWRDGQNWLMDRNID